MLKQMLLGLGAASLLVVVTAMPVQAGHIDFLPLLGHEPDSSVIVTRGAWEWVWVSPCPPDERGSCSMLEGENFGFGPPVITATSNPWTDSFDGFLEANGSLQGPNSMTGAFFIFNSLNEPISTRCATPYFSQDFTDCHSTDLARGIVWQADLPGVVTDTILLPSAEVFWVRASTSEPPPPLPEPSSLLLLGAGLLGLAAWRWKHSA